MSLSYDFNLIYVSQNKLHDWDGAKKKYKRGDFNPTEAKAIFFF